MSTLHWHGASPSAWQVCLGLKVELPTSGLSSALNMEPPSLTLSSSRARGHALRPTPESGGHSCPRLEDQGLEEPALLGRRQRLLRLNQEQAPAEAEVVEVAAVKWEGRTQVRPRFCTCLRWGAHWLRINRDRARGRPQAAIDNRTGMFTASSFPINYLSCQKFALSPFSCQPCHRAEMTGEQTAGEELGQKAFASAVHKAPLGLT